MSDFWAWRPFSVGIKKNKQALGNTKKVLTEATKLRERSPLAEYDEIDFAIEVIKGALHDVDFWPSETIVHALVDMLEQVYHDEALGKVDESVLTLNPNSRDAIAVREYLRRQIRFVENYSVYMPAFKNHITQITRYLMTLIPVPVLLGENDGSFLSVRYSDLLENVADTVDVVGGAGFDENLVSLNLFETLRNRYEANVMNVSKIDPRLPPINRHRYITPMNATNLNDDEIVEQYLVGTPFRKFFNTEVPLPLNEQARFEHSHILGGTGHGKTQFIQKWIVKDLEMAMREKRSVVVIDSQGDLINKIARLNVFDPEYGALRDKIVIIDPTDVQFPAAINMFAMDEERLTSYGPVEREKVQNSAIALYEHFFGELLGAELTAKQGVVFKYLARLMLEIPDATILTLRDLVDDPKPFIPYMEKLTGSARVFFAREFLDKSFNQTRKQISKRLWGVLSTPAFERLFSSTETKIDLFKLMNEGHIILISTAKDLLKQDGASLYGRFFLSMIGQAIMERAVVPEHDRTPTFLYIDECQDYFDETIEVLLAQGRKYKIGVTLAHQYLDQLDTSGRSSVLANTSIKAAGGMNTKDAKTLASEMRVSADYLQAMRKTDFGSDFAFWVKNDLPSAIKVNVPFGHLERIKRMPDDVFRELLEKNREHYCWKYVAQESAVQFSFNQSPERSVEKPKPERKPRVVATRPEVIDCPSDFRNEARELPREIPLEETPEPLPRGKGGKRHIYLQNLIKQLASNLGWRVEIEYSVSRGAGQIDVALLQGDKLIACEISVTTSAEHEVENIIKCFKAGAGEVWVISEEQSKLSVIETLTHNSSGIDAQKLRFLLPDDIPSELENISAELQGKESTIHGYRVKINRSVGSQKEAEDRRSRILAALASR